MDSLPDVEVTVETFHSDTDPVQIPPLGQLCAAAKETKTKSAEITKITAIFLNNNAGVNTVITRSGMDDDNLEGV